MNYLVFILVALSGIIPAGEAYITPLQKRDSILIADQIEYGIQLDSVSGNTSIALPDFSKASNDTLSLVRNWKLDTLSAGKIISKKQFEKILKNGKTFGIRASVILAPFEEGRYSLPDIAMQRKAGDRIDTLLFKGLEIEVKTMPVDTANFVIHDIKGQINYPITFREVYPWVLVFIFLVAITAFIIFLIKRHRAKLSLTEGRLKDPAHILALRELEKFRGDKFWAPEKQKFFYSGITDTLKFYIEERFGVDAPEMTTAELFSALKDFKNDISEELFTHLRALFDCADFVKFAKHTASEEDNAKALPVAIRFVTSTYQSQIEKDSTGEEAGKKS